MAYCIGSFNLRDFNFSNTARDNSGEIMKRDCEKIAKIIIEENFDILALQELNAPLPLKNLVNILNNHKNRSRAYSFSFGENMPVQLFSRDPERYGFIWNNKRVRLLKTKRNNNPCYYSNAGAISLIRPPYYARFTTRGMLGGTNFEIRIVNTHIRDATREEERILEFNTLVKQVLPRICDLQELSEDGEFMPSYTFLMGDYNLSLNKSERSIYKIEKITPTNYTGKWRSYNTIQNMPTTLRLPNNQSFIEECYANDYDHFTYETDLDLKLIITPQRVEPLIKYFKDSNDVESKLKSYRTEISDHVPIKMIVDLK